MTAESVLKESGVKAGLSDRINPIVVKELRQAVQSRFVVAALLTLISIQLIAIGIYILASGAALFDYDAGRQTFIMLFAILQVIGMLFVPLYTAVRLAAERSDTNVDLLFITTIKPRSIISGKMIAALTLTALIYSACMPFMTFTYFLRGIDLPSIFISLGIGFVVVVACAQAAVFVACIPVNRAFKVIFGLIALIVFGVVYFATVGGVNEVVSRGFLTRISWQPIIASGASVFFLIGLFFVMSVALIMPVASNRALPVRLFITTAWLFTGMAAMTSAVIEKEHWPVILWLIAFEIIFALAIFVAVSERDQPGRRVLRSISKSPVGRAWAFFFFSGAANGLAWASVLVVLTLAAAWVLVKLFPRHNDVGALVESAKWMGGMCLYFFCYAMTGALLRRHLFSRVGTELTWLIGAILLFMGSLIPFLIGYLVFFHDQWWAEDFNAWWVGNPFAFGNKSHRVLYSSVAGVWAVVVVALSLHWFIERARGFNPSRALAENLDEATYQNTITLGLN
ncbi:MAG TPA: hypothetical protein VJ810_38570, partial [Blastocatellia bacterium]|nr:hypothetical protein [Blastocatellia bacterium]